MRKLLIALLAVLTVATAATVTVSAAKKSSDDGKILDWPVPDYEGLTSCFTDQRSHNAIDISANPGNAVTAAADGTVTIVNDTCKGNHVNGECSCSDGYGKNVWIKHVINGATYYTHYSHLSVISVKKGQTVKSGEEIAKIGNTGHSYGGHLDFQVGVGSTSQIADPGLFLHIPAGLKHTGTSPECCNAYIEGLYRTDLVTDGFTLKNLTQPKAFQVLGRRFSLRGTVSANSSRVITRIIAETLDRTSGKAIDCASHTIYPNSLSFNFLELGSALAFEQLTAGEYTFRLTARDEVGNTQILTECNFTVGDPALTGEPETEPMGTEPETVLETGSESEKQETKKPKTALIIGLSVAGAAVLGAVGYLVVRGKKTQR